MIELTSVPHRHSQHTWHGLHAVSGPRDPAGRNPGCSASGTTRQVVSDQCARARRRARRRKWAWAGAPLSFALGSRALLIWAPGGNNSDNGPRMKYVRAIAYCLAFGLNTAVCFQPASAQQIAARYDVSGQIDSEKVPNWMAGAARTDRTVFRLPVPRSAITVSGDKYVVESTATGAAFLSKFFDNLRVVRRSEGAWVSGAQATTRFYEQRGSTEPATAVIDYRSGTLVSRVGLGHRRRSNPSSS